MEGNRARRRAFVWGAARNVAHIVLSNGFQTATSDGTPTTHFAGRSTAVIGAGKKKYWEVKIDNVDIAHSVGVGVASAAATFGDDSYLGILASGLGYYDTDGQTYSNATLVATLAVFGTGDVIGIACRGGGKIWFRVNGGAWNNTTDDPATDTGGIDISAMGDVYPAYDVRQAGKVTANFSQTFRDAAPSGFTRFPW